MSKISRRDILGYLGAGGVAATATAFFKNSSGTATATPQTTHQRILQNGTLRCGYFISPPWFSLHDDGTHGGVYYEIMEALGRALSLKIEWVAEIPIADFPAALSANRIDVYAAPVAPTAHRARGADFLNMITAVPFTIGMRSGSSLAGNWRQLNNQSITVSSIEGAMNDVLGKKFFPATRALTLPQTASFSDIFVNVATHKADIVIQDSVSMHNFIRNNPGSLKIVSNIPPVVVLPWTMAVKKNEFALKQMLNAALDDLQTMGEINAINQAHGVYDDGVFPPAQPYGPTIALERT